MNTVTMLEFRRDAERILGRVRRGQRLVLTYRGKAVAQLLPVEQEAPPPDDPLYQLADHAEPGGESLTNEQIDRIVYGE